jgi:hypothetical protein
MRTLASLLVAALLVLGDHAVAQRPDPAALIASQTEAMRALASMDGQWRGTATVSEGEGSRLSFTQTERIGPFLGGSVKVIEGRGYSDTGAVRFNALGIVSFDPATRAYTLHSHALGRVGDFAFVPTADGYRWEIPLGPAGTIRYVATIKDGELHEVGDRIAPDGAALRIFEMRLKRIGDSDWPAAGAVGPK